MNTENQNNPNAPAPGETEGSELKDTVGWIFLKVGAGYLAKVILDALGF